MRRSWAMSLDTWRRPSISCWMRLSMALRLGDELVDLVVGAAHGNARREIALHDGAAGAGDGVDAAQEARADQRAAGDREQQREPARPGEGADDGVLHVGQPVGVLGHQQERAVGQGEAEAGELGRARRRARASSRLRHEIDDAVDRRHARQVADHDPAVGRLQQIEDRTARAEVHAPRDLLGEARAGRCGDGSRPAGRPRCAAPPPCRSASPPSPSSRRWRTARRPTA